MEKVRRNDGTVKTWGYFILAVALLIPAFGQETTTEVSVATEVSDAAAKKRAQELKAKQEADALLARKPIIYGGFATDLKKSTNAPKTLSLRQPNNPKVDQENVYFDEKTGRAKGFTLFRVSY